MRVAGKTRAFLLPLRLLSTAVQWRAKPNPRLLLGLPLEERRILERLLPETWRGETR
jgi:hypothetical protein